MLYWYMPHIIIVWMFWWLQFSGVVHRIFLAWVLADRVWLSWHFLPMLKLIGCDFYLYPCNFYMLPMKCELLSFCTPEIYITYGSPLSNRKHISTFQALNRFSIFYSRCVKNLSTSDFKLSPMCDLPYTNLMWKNYVEIWHITLSSESCDIETWTRVNLCSVPPVP